MIQKFPQVDPDQPDKTAFGEMSVMESTPQFHITFPYNINTNLVTSSVSGSGSFSHASAHAYLSTGAASGSSASLSSIDALKYSTGQGGLGRFTAIFNSGVDGNTQIIGLGTQTEGFFFGYSGTSFGILRKNNDIETWITQANWSEDKVNGTGKSGMTLDPTKGNVYQIRYQWLGYGEIRFYVEDPNQGIFILVHKIQYANQNTDVSIQDPTFKLYAETKNTTASSNVTLKTPSWAAFIEGKDVKYGVLQASSYSKTSITTEKPIICFRVTPTYNGKTNYAFNEILRLGMSSEGNRPVIFSVIKNPTTLSASSFNSIDTSNSITQVDIAASARTGGKVITAYTLGRTDSKDINLESLGIRLYPGEILVITAECPLSTEVAATLIWKERL